MKNFNLFIGVDYMNSKLKEDQWVWVIIQDPEKNPQYLGQHDEAKDVSYIPVFMEKDHALQCMNLLKKDKSFKYESQAVFYGDLVKDAKENEFLILILDGEGKQVEWIQP
jgi:hypothetical protein